MAIFIEIGAYEAKTHLSDFLRKVKAGNTYRITQRGEPMADLVPAALEERRAPVAAATRMLAFMREQPAITGIDVKSLIAEGRD
ncbi:MAG: type II toxin-antitoxin system prevent-host-death family antitoxin [Rhodocyclaceae bacterium]|nr:type II toxin-antitoxin system prevent-host-death family antitoxin [Rhodocyclaceae bacterium]MDZ4215097.1 type II toxin-antitoxin system prevent-host-death family antitoxin [Rhodocyclaceae bacterium]